jgi:chloride channel 3/4/5
MIVIGTSLRYSSLPYWASSESAHSHLRHHILIIIQGLYGALVVEFAVQVAKFRRRHLANHAVAEAVGLATLTALIGYGNRFLRIDMTESMAVLFRECEAGGDLDNLCQ